MFVLTMGISESASRAIVARLADRSGTMIEVRPSPALASDRIPAISLASVLRLDGVRSVGTMSSTDVPVDAVAVRTGESAQIPLVALSPQADVALDLNMSAGRFIAPPAHELGLPIAVLGRGAAERLQVRSLATVPTVDIRGVELAVTGIIADSPVVPELLNAIVVPDSLADLHRIDGIDRIVVRTTRESRDAIADVVARAILPNQPAGLQVIVPTGEQHLQEVISRELDALLVATGLVTLAIGAIAVGNVMLLNVIERRTEIGLRRALGARRSHITTQFLAESAALGAIGAILGTSVGVIGVVGVATINGWAPTMPASTPFLAVLGGVLVGITSGIVAARRAATVEPITALRSG